MFAKTGNSKETDMKLTILILTLACQYQANLLNRYLDTVQPHFEPTNVEWISIYDRLPQTDIYGFKRVLVSHHTGVHQAQYHDGKFWLYGWTEIGATYWRPMPNKAKTIIINEIAKVER